MYALAANSAAAKVEEARELGAEQYAAYDFYLATEHLTKAQTEASEADYSDAANLAEKAEQHADKAIQLAREAHRGAGR
jgi:arginyl-tRNA--protein-N-Asp/Glu arginylyltransferase